MSVKGKLILFAVTALAALAILFAVEFVGGALGERSQQISEAASEARIALLEAQNFERSFHEFHKDAYADDLKKSIALLTGQAAIIAELEPEYATLAGDVAEKGQQYEKQFQKAVLATRSMGYTKADGLQGRLHGSISTLEARIREIGLNMDEILQALLMLRRSEKDYLIGHDTSDLDKFREGVAQLQVHIQSNGVLNVKKETQAMMDLATEYVEAFEAYAQQYQDMTSGRKKLKALADDLGGLVTQLEQDARQATAGMARMTKMLSFGVGGVTVVILIIMVALIIRSIIGPLSRLQAYAQQVAGGDFSEVSADGFSGELRSLYDDISAMVREIKTKLGFSNGVLTGVSMPCAVVGPDKKIVYANQQICDLLEKPEPPEAYAGTGTGEFFLNEPGRETLSDHALDQRESLEDEVNTVSNSGRRLVVSVTSTPFYDMDGELLGVLTMWYNLTELRQQQKLVEEQNKVIAQAATDADSVSEQVASASEQLSAQIEEGSKGAQQQRSRTSEVATAVEQMSATVLEVAKNASSSAELATETRGKAQEGQRMVSRMVEINADLGTLADSLKGEMADLGRQADGIGTIMGVITDIADQTNLLALNAAIEAARAGDAGRGFAVVADEVRKLAEKTMQATGEVGSYIQSIQQSAHRNIQATDQTTEVIQQSARMSAEAGNALQEIVKFVEQTNDQVREIAAASEEQSAASEQIAHAAEEINGTAEDTARAMSESASAVSGLANMAGDLKEIISRMQN